MWTRCFGACGPPFCNFAGSLQVLTSPVDIEMWGDGKQTRSFTFIDDCVEGILRITKSDFKEPLNLGSSEMVRPRPSMLHRGLVRSLAVFSDVVLMTSGLQLFDE